jgi:hypothetical protein
VVSANPFNIKLEVRENRTCFNPLVIMPATGMIPLSGHETCGSVTRGRVPYPGRGSLSPPKFPDRLKFLGKP